MLIEDVKSLSPEERFVYWIKERESIRVSRLLRSRGPWTNDTILQKYRFCNVRRMDDRVSQWLYQYWYKKYKNHPNMLVAATLARHFNLPQTLDKVGFPKRWDPDWIKRIVRREKDSGFTVFNSAYMVRGIGAIDKTEMVIDRVCQPLVDHPPELNTNSMQHCVEALVPYWGLSHFMAGQVVADLRWGITGKWKDRHTWASKGPGSVRGMNRLLLLPLNQPMSQEKFSLLLLERVIQPLQGKIGTVAKHLEAIDYQNCLCEWDKYERTLLEGRRPKRLFT